MPALTLKPGNSLSPGLPPAEVTADSGGTPGRGSPPAGVHARRASRAGRGAGWKAPAPRHGVRDATGGKPMFTSCGLRSLKETEPYLTWLPTAAVAAARGQDPPGGHHDPY